MEEKRIYSYHTFLFPFLLKNGMTKDKLCEQLQLRDGPWCPDDMIVENAGEKQLSAVVRDRNLDKACWDYQTFQYFNAATRKALFEAEGGVSSGYRIKNAKGGTYTIVYRKDKVGDGGGRSYVLDINAIRLKVFNTNVAVISFELEYPMPSAGAAQARKDVKIINEFGRRLYPEFLVRQPEAPEERPFLLCADSIAIDFPDGKTISTEFRENATIQDDSAFSNLYLNKPIHLPSILTELTGIREENIEPAVDDRMFVCSCVLDQEYTNSFIRLTTPQNHQWRFMEDWETGCELYAVINIDAGSSSCQNRLMLDQYFEEQLYLRWIEYGTIHAVTNHSMICLTGDPQDGVMNSVVNPFLLLYVPMCILGLAQRGSLLAYDARITEAIKKAQPGEVPLDGALADHLIVLAEQFAVFQGQLLLQEVTPQIQGVELYAKIQKMLFIPSLEKNIHHQMNNLYQIAEAKRAKLDSEKNQKMQGAFTAIAILAVASAWGDTYDFIQHIVTGEELTLALWWSVALAVLLIVFGIFEYWYKGRMFRCIKKICSLFHRKRKKGDEKQ